ncbi:MAG: type 1 glutamine amidotransferase [Alphaproteobacteria bacterium]|nr:type 1 glutamine amidotransferase [Alphaproteobacteria bacterium]
MKLRLGVVEAYDSAGRAEITAAGCTEAGKLYSTMLETLRPDTETIIIKAADPDGAVPNGASLAELDGLAWTGSSLTVYHDEPRVTRQVALAREAFRSGVPQFGSCWALQVAAVAAGGSCRRNPNGREFGVARKITLTDGGRAHPLHAGRATAFDGFTSHLDVVSSLPAGAESLSGNAMTPIQSAVIAHEGGTFWGLQFHPEYDLHEVASLARCRRAALIREGLLADEAAADAYIEALETLHRAPDRSDLRFVLGLDDDVIDPARRRIEVANWLTYQVEARRAARS